MAAGGAVPAVGLARGDGVTHAETDYVVELTVTYFAVGQTWRLHRLGAAGAERGPDGHRAYRGNTVEARSLEVWPAAELLQELR